MTASAQNSLDAETETLIAVAPVAGSLCADSHPGAYTGQDAYTGRLIAVAHALRGEGHDASEDGTGRGTPIIAIQERAVSENPDAGPDGMGCSTEGAAYTLEARTQVQAVAFAENQRGEVALSDVASQLNTGGGKPGQGYPAVAIHSDAIGRTGEALTESVDAAGVSRLRDPGLGILDDGSTYNLMATGQPHAVAFSFKDYGNDAREEASPTLRSLGHYDANGGSQLAVAWSLMPQNSGKDFKARAVDVSQPLMAGGPTGGNQGGDYIQPDPWAVRRLTPRECERLQGFPDGFTAIPWRGKPAELCPDGPRYKALGNSWEVNVAEWVGGRIAEDDSWGNAA